MAKKTTLIQGKRIITDSTFRKMHPVFRNVVMTSILLLDSNDGNMSGILKMAPDTFYHFLNETEHGGEDILKAVCNNYPEWIAYDFETNELAVLIWPNMTVVRYGTQQLKYLWDELQEVESMELLQKMTKLNHRRATELYQKRILQIAAERTNKTTFLKNSASPSQLTDTDNIVDCKNKNKNIIKKDKLFFVQTDVAPEAEKPVKKSIKKTGWKPPVTEGEISSFKNQVFLHIKPQIQKLAKVGVNAHHWAIFEAAAFFDHYSEVNWSTGRSRKMKNWKSAATGWVTRSAGRRVYFNHCITSEEFKKMQQGANKYQIDDKPEVYIRG